MNRLKIENLPKNLELDHQAMLDIAGCGLWDSAKKYAKKAGRYAKKRARQKIQEYRRGYYSVKQMPRTFYSAGRSVARDLYSIFF